MRTTSRLGVTFFGLAVLAAASAQARDACEATPIDMLGGSSAHVTGLNNWGQVVGGINFDVAPTSAFRWERGTTRLLPSLPEATATYATAINDLGLIVGGATVAREDVPLLWTRSRVHRLSGEGLPTDINFFGQIVGNRRFSECMFWASPWSEPVPMGSLGGSFCFVHAINDRGQAVGGATTASGEMHAFLWEQGEMRDLGTIANPGYSSAELLDINNRGLAVGRVLRSPVTTDLLLWSEKGGLRSIVFPLPGLPEIITDGPASSVNEWGLVVAHNYDSTYASPAHLLIVNEAGQVREVGTLGGYVSYDDVHVNERFQIAWDADLVPYFCQLPLGSLL